MIRARKALASVARIGNSGKSIDAKTISWQASLVFSLVKPVANRFHVSMKHSLRREISEKLSSMSPAVRHAKSMAVCKRLTAATEFTEAKVIMIYLPLPDEVDISPVALRGWQEQKVIAAPKLTWDKRHMLPIEINSLEMGLVSTRHGLREPAAGEPLPAETIDMVLVPALVFDKKGNRIGRGAGFYDRFLASPEFKGVSVGVAFEEQVVDNLPVEPHDVPVDILITDEKFIRIKTADNIHAG